MERNIRENELLDRYELIEDSLEGYEEELRERPDSELVGEERLENLRKAKIQALTERYAEELEVFDVEDLLGEESLAEMREGIIEELVTQERRRLESMTDEELIESGGAGYILAEPE